MVLELAVWRIKLGRKPAVNPQLNLIMEARVRLLRGWDGESIYRATFPYRSAQSRTFVEWAEADAQPLREELGRAYQALAEAIVQTVLMPPDPARKAPRDGGKFTPASPSIGR